MSPQRTKTYIRLFTVLSLGVIVNLLALQPRLNVKGQSSGHLGTSAGGEALVSRVVPVAAPSPDMQADTVRAIQRELKDLGHYPGDIDGRASLLTHAAILAYQQQRGMALSGEPSEMLLQTMILGPQPKRVPGTAAASLVSGSPADRLVIAIRQMLNGLGYQTGRHDGRLSPELIAAIRSYETDNGLLPSTGRVTPLLLLHLQRKIATRR